MGMTGSPQTVGLAVVALVGLVLWAMGRKLARPGYALSGLLGGVVFALAIPQARQNTQTLMVAILVASLVGMLLAWLMFRVATGFTLAVTLAVVLPAAELAWQSDHFPQFPDIGIQMQAPTKESAEVETAPPIGSDFFTKEPNMPPEYEKVYESFQALDTMKISSGLTNSLKIPTWTAEKTPGEIIKQWINQFDESARRATVVLALCGAVLGLFIGLIAPYWAVSCQTALVGSGMMLISAHHLLPRLSESLSSPLIDTPQQGIICLSLITVAGIGLQWITWRKKADR